MFIITVCALLIGALPLALAAYVVYRDHVVRARITEDLLSLVLWGPHRPLMCAHEIREARRKLRKLEPGLRPYWSKRLEVLEAACFDSRAIEPSLAPHALFEQPEHSRP